MNDKTLVIVDAGHGGYWKIQVIIMNDYKCK